MNSCGDCGRAKKLPAWVRLGTPQPAEVRHEVSRILAAQYGGDPGAVDPHQSGRLAGFTNPKPEHRTRAGAPFAKLHRFAGAVVQKATELIEAARAALARRAEVASILGDACQGHDILYSTRILKKTGLRLRDE